ncbi:hypothetical protein AJ80_09738 [Polytolypa hystricis UAMH7299]|uniref:Integral membrane protein n=1 Tax=Polytolypa hystricis (strain UAMH7299) TaxID=1447883 RepID=A0A2B7WKP7_POLH7|nr:hypothetical protein AJ80_09738 [Polytolypa hystricis UAMH7299]
MQKIAKPQSLENSHHHPLQRLRSPSRGVSTLIHLAGLISFAKSFKFIIDNPNQANEAYGWHFQYLTIIGLTLATLTCVAGLLADILLSRRLFLVKNVLSVCSAPLAVLVSLLYWGLRIIDERLVLPEWAVLNFWADVGFHAIPGIILVVDLLLLSPPWTITALPSMCIACAIAFSYWFWIELCYTNNGWYPYPIFGLLTTGWRVVLFLFSASMMTTNTIALKWLHARVNSSGAIKAH